MFVGLGNFGIWTLVRVCIIQLKKIDKFVRELMASQVMGVRMLIKESYEWNLVELLGLIVESEGRGL